VDAIESSSSAGSPLIKVTGILVGETAPTTVTFQTGTAADMTTRCERLGLLAMAKPGRYLFAIGGPSTTPATCKLITVAP
jgi:hypothetical protein